MRNVQVVLKDVKDVDPHDLASIFISIKLRVSGFLFSISNVVPFPVSTWPWWVPKRLISDQESE